VPAEKPTSARKQKVKNDPRLVAAARELRDRWLEKINSREDVIESSGKYDVARLLPDGRGTIHAEPQGLIAA
jgi:hypothetical protein